MAIGLGNFAGQLTADELARAYASAGGHADDLRLAPEPVREPPPNPYVEPAPPNMSLQAPRGPSGRAIQQLDQQQLADANQRIDLAGRGGEEQAQAFEQRAGVRRDQAMRAKETVEGARADMAQRRAHEDKYQAEADRIYEEMKAHTQPPPPSVLSKVMSIVAMVAASQGKGGAAQGASMVAGMFGKDPARWEAEQRANSHLYQNALSMVGSDREGESHDLDAAQRITALEGHEYELALQTIAEQSQSSQMRQAALDTQLELRMKTRSALRAMEEAKLKAGATGQKSAREKYFWDIPFDQLQQMPSNILSQDGQKVLAERTKIEKGQKDLRGGENGTGQEVLPGYVATVPLEKKDVSDIRANAQLLERIKGNYAQLTKIREKHRGRPFSAWTDANDKREAGNIISEMTGTLNQFGGRGAPSNAELEDMRAQLLDPTDTYVLTEPAKVYQEQINRLETNFRAGLNAVGVQRADAPARQGGAPAAPAGADPRVRPGFAAPSAASRGVSLGLPADSVTLNQIRAAAAQQDAQDAQRDATQAQLARWMR